MTSGRDRGRDAASDSLFRDIVTFVDTGHARCNELLGDSRLICGAMHSTAPMEGEGRARYAIAALHHAAPGWRVCTLAARWPDFPILSSDDRRHVTHPANDRPVPHLDHTTGTACVAW